MQLLANDIIFQNVKYNNETFFLLLNKNPACGSSVHVIKFYLVQKFRTEEPLHSTSSSHNRNKLSLVVIVGKMFSCNLVNGLVCNICASNINFANIVHSRHSPFSFCFPPSYECISKEAEWYKISFQNISEYVHKHLFTLNIFYFSVVIPNIVRHQCEIEFYV